MSCTPKPDPLMSAAGEPAKYPPRKSKMSWTLNPETWLKSAMQQGATVLPGALQAMPIPANDEMLDVHAEGVVAMHVTPQQQAPVASWQVSGRQVAPTVKFPGQFSASVTAQLVPWQHAPNGELAVTSSRYCPVAGVGCPYPSTRTAYGRPPARLTESTDEPSELPVAQAGLASSLHAIWTKLWSSAQLPTEKTVRIVSKLLPQQETRYAAVAGGTKVNQTGLPPGWLQAVPAPEGPWLVGAALQLSPKTGVESVRGRPSSQV